MATGVDHKKALAGQFQAEYERLCFLQDVCPISQITANLKENFIDINVDRIRANEWATVLDALKVNNSLRFVALRSSWSPANVEDKKRKQHHGKKKTPVIRSRDMTLKLCKALKDCLAVSQCLECLLIQNLPLREPDVRLLAKGVSRSVHLKYFSLEQCHIGDELFDHLVPCIKKSPSLVSVCFSACNLTWKAAEQVASIIKYQASQRHGEAWQDSLRYRRPDLDRMNGLHRVTLCDNSLGDSGARILADALKDDLWLKALDLQNCSISIDGAQILKESLAFNRSLWVLDLRRNHQIEYDLLRSIIEQVMINAGGEHDEYPWISSEETRNKLKNKLTKSPATAATSSGGKRKPAKASTRVRRKESLDATYTAANYSKSVHYPWRTGERVKRNRHRTNNPLENSRSYTQIQATTTAGSRGASPVKSQQSLLKSAPGDGSESDPVLQLLHEERQATDPKLLEMLNSLQMESNFYKQKLEDERRAHAYVCEKLADVSEENKRLKFEMDKLRSEIRDGAMTATEGGKSKKMDENLKNNDLEDEDVLNGIESSFQRFQQFLDMLEELGLGDLYARMQDQLNGGGDVGDLVPTALLENDLQGDESL